MAFGRWSYLGVAFLRWRRWPFPAGGSEARLPVETSTTLA